MYSDEYYEIEMEKQHHKCKWCGVHTDDIISSFAIYRDPETFEWEGLICSVCNDIRTGSIQETDRQKYYDLNKSIISKYKIDNENKGKMKSEELKSNIN